MPDATFAADMPVDRNIVRRVREDHPRLGAGHQRGDHLAVERIAADQPVRAELPNVARLTARRPSADLGHAVVGRIARLLWCLTLNQAVDLGDREAGDLDVEAEVMPRKLAELERQKFLVPAGVERKLVVGDDIGPLLLGAHAFDGTHGTRSILSSFAASTRPWPARMCLSSSISTDLVKPNVLMLSAIWRTCLREWVRALRGHGRSGYPRPAHAPKSPVS